MKNLILVITLFCCSLCFGQLPSSGNYCIDVVKSDNGKYYALYSDNTWKESTQATSEVFRAVSNRSTLITKNTINANNFQIASESPIKSTGSQNNSQVLSVFIRAFRHPPKEQKIKENIMSTRLLLIHQQRQFDRRD